MSEFNLPGSSFDELQKIVQGYSNAKEAASLSDIAKLIGIHETSISRNNKFLVDVGLITGGRAKAATGLGRRLGRALEHAQADDVRACWKEAVQTNEKLSGIVTTVRIKGGIDEAALSNHILYVSGQGNNKSNAVGARCVASVLITAGLVAERDGKIIVVSPKGTDEKVATPPPAIAPEQQENYSSEFVQLVAPSATANVASPSPQVAINIQLHLPEADRPEIYKELFKALREELLEPGPGRED